VRHVRVKEVGDRMTIELKTCGVPGCMTADVIINRNISDWLNSLIPSYSCVRLVRTRNAL
jgi:hypothetical protein